MKKMLLKTFLKEKTFKNPTNFNLDEIPWSSDDASEVIVPVFHESVGPTNQLPCDATPLDFLNLLLTVELMTTIVEYINIHYIICNNRLS